MTPTRQVAAADLKAGDVLLLSATEPLLTRQIKAVAPRNKDGQVELVMEGLDPKRQGPWCMPPYCMVTVLDVLDLEPEPTAQLL